MFKTHKSIEKNKSVSQIKTEVNALNIRGEYIYKIRGWVMNITYSNYRPKLSLTVCIIFKHNCRIDVYPTSSSTDE